MTTTERSPADATGTLGTFGGVFTPSILTILGLVLFLRVAFVVGSVGLVQALVILALSTAVSVLTSISLAVVATNMRVRGGGEYFLISRTLGIEFGGAVGVVLYLAISVSIAFYAIGFAEALVDALGSDSPALIRLIAAGLVLLLTGVGYVGADLATRLQYLVMALLVVALVSFFVGSIGDFSAEQLSDNLGRPDSEVGFWEAFAIFFPAVTGFSQGVAMSGDLKSPSRSITRGTLAAVGLSTAVYLAVIVVLAGSAGATVLVEDTSSIMGELSLAGWTILVGVLAATLSSALASTLGGPRVLQRLGEDRVLPRLEFFEVGAGPGNNPRRALAISTAIAFATIAAGDLNAVAPVISMFFLASYGMINYATYYEFRAGSTSFRPRFRWGDHRASLAGTIACGGAIVAINPLAGALAALVLLGLYSYLRQRDVPDRWVDSAGSHHYTRVRQHLHSLADEPMGSRDWRPCILAFVPRDPTNRRRMITMASWLEGGSGFLTAVRILEGSGPVGRRQAREIEEDLGDEVESIADGAFARVLLVGDDEVGVQTLVQAHGIGNVRANLTVFGVRDLRGSEADRQTYGSMLQNCVRFGTNVAVINVRDDAWEHFEATAKGERSIALWWSDDQVGQLITLLGWLCQRHRDWEDASIVVYVPASDDPMETARVAKLLEDARIRAEVVAVDRTPAAFSAALGGATMALAPLRVRRGNAIGPFETPLGMLVESLPLAVMILATETLDLDAQPDEGELAELAQAADRAKKSAKWVAELDREAARLLVEEESLRLQLESDGLEPGTRSELELQLAEIEAAAAKAYRKYVDARARHAVLNARVAELESAGGAGRADPDIWLRSSHIGK
ncbi:MAG: amino acid permease [Acidimicrobiia bacterium]|nr:amino acid permease [Acidimicrobiia bacterium]